MKNSSKSIVKVKVLLPVLVIVIAAMMPPPVSAQKGDLSTVFTVPDNMYIPAGCREYGGAVFTGDAVGAGTDANIYLTINGDRGSTGEINITKGNSTTNNTSDPCSINGTEFKLVKYGSNLVAGGDVDYKDNLNERNTSYLIAIWARDVGNIRSITVRSDNFGSDPAWLLKEIDVDDNVFWFDTWLQSGSLSATATPLNKNKVFKYDITIYTGDVTGAGTDANIDLTIYGDGQQKTFRLNPLISGNAFERNQTDTLTLKNVGILTVDKITLTSDNSYAGAAWYLGWIDIKVAGYENPGRFTCNCWIDSDNPSRTLTSDFVKSQTPGNLTPEQLQQYKQAVLDWYNQQKGSSNNNPSARGGFQLLNNNPSAPPQNTKNPASIPKNPANTVSLERQCFDQVQGKVAWNTAGDKTWGEPNLRALCKGTQNPARTIACFKAKMPQLGWKTATAQCAGGVGGTGKKPLGLSTNPPSNSSATKLPGLARDIDVKNGSVWVIGTQPVSGGYHIRHLINGKWQLIDGGAIHIAVDNSGNPWVVHSDGTIFRRSGNTWTVVPPPRGYTARDIAITRGGVVWIVTDAGSVTSWTGAGWTNLFALNAKEIIALPNPDTLQVVDNNGKRWTRQSDGSWLIQPDASGLAGKYVEFAVDADGTKWGIDSSFSIWKIGTGSQK